jgi:diguanylate cyclase (GGDEF)-like protein
LREQLGALQSAASDLVSGDDLQTVLQRIADRTASEIIAQGYLLAVEDPYGGALRVHWSGMDDERANRLASRLVAGGDELGPSAVVVDVASARRHHGRLAAVYPEGQRGPAAERLLLEAYAGHAAAALDTILALEDARRGEERANALLRLATALAHAHTTAEVTQIVASALPRIAGTSRASILLWDAESGQLTPAARAAAGNGDHGAFWRFVATPEDSPTLARMLRLPRPFVVRLAEAEPVVRDVLRALGGGDIAITPMLSDGRLIGVLTTNWTGRDDTPEFFELAARLEGVASQAVPALLNAELVAKVRHQSLHDGLTALPNRRLLGDRASDAGHERGPVAMLFCDLDRFKTINDTLGHTAGDELLRQVATRLTACVRDGDTVARLSGDEFAILLPSVSNPGEAHDVAGRVVASLARPFLIEGHELTVTASVGVAFDATGDEDPEDLLRSADEAMYEAKRRGRNQVAQLAGQSS